MNRIFILSTHVKWNFAGAAAPLTSREERLRPAKSFDELKESISERYGQLSGRLRQIAEFALQHPNELALGTVATVSTSAGVQPSAVIRFANLFGFKGFVDLQQVFRERLVAASPSYRERIAGLRQARGNGRARGKATDPAHVLADFVADGIAALEHLQQQIRPAEMERAVKALARAREIHVLAQGRAFPVAFYLNYALRRLDQRSYLIDSLGGMTRVQAAGIAKGDVLVAASFKDYSPDVVEIVRDCRARGIEVVALTDSPLSPIAAGAVAALEVSEDPDMPFRSLVAPICFAQSLVVALGHYLAARQAAQ